MNTIISTSVSRPRCSLALLGLLASLTALPALAGDDAGMLIDDFSDANLTKTGVERPVIDDKALGGESRATKTCEDGVLSVEGELIPGRGSPAFISVPLMLSPEGKPQDLSAYKGVRLRVKVLKGILSVQVSSSEIDNYDYHTSAPITRSPDEFKEVRIAFKDLKRAWSEQTALNLGTITSVNLVAAGMARDAFAYEIDEIGFY